MLVNPFDTASVKEAIVAAVHTSEHDARLRMRDQPPRHPALDGARLVEVVPRRRRQCRALGRAGPGRTMIEGPPDIRSLSSTPHLLVACDYDGTLAPIVDDPTPAHRFPAPSPRCARWPRCPTPTSRSSRAARCATCALWPLAGRGPPRRQPRHRVRRSTSPRSRPSARSVLRRDRARARCASPPRRPAQGSRTSPSRRVPLPPRRPGRPRRMPRRRGGRAWPTGCTTSRAPRQGGRRALGAPHRQGRRAQPLRHRWAPPRCSSSATTSPTRMRSPR